MKSTGRENLRTVNVAELEDGHDRPKDLLLGDLHLVLDTREDGGLNEEAAAAPAVATALEVGALLLAGLDVAEDLVELLLINLSALLGLLVRGVAEDALLGALHGELHELVVDLLVAVDARGGAAALALVEEQTKVSDLDGLSDVGVVHDDEGRLAAELEGDILEVRVGRGALDEAANLRGAGEGDLVDVHVVGETSAGSGAVTGEDVNHARGEAGLEAELEGLVSVQRWGSESNVMPYLTSAEGGERGLLGGLHDHAVAAGEERADLPGPHEQREVPRDDDATDADGLEDSVDEGLGR